MTKPTPPGPPPQEWPYLLAVMVLPPLSGWYASQAGLPFWLAVAGGGAFGYTMGVLQQRRRDAWRRKGMAYLMDTGVFMWKPGARTPPATDDEGQTNAREAGHVHDGQRDAGTTGDH